MAKPSPCPLLQEDSLWCKETVKLTLKIHSEFDLQIFINSRLPTESRKKNEREGTRDSERNA